MEFVITIIAICTVGSIINTWIRAKHGYPMKDDNGDETVHSAPAQGEVRKLAEQNSRLASQLENATDRIAVLERIVTDQGYHTARQIEALRDLPTPVADSSTGSGVPLGLQRENAK